jgi:hypothetical protein
MKAVLAALVVATGLLAACESSDGGGEERSVGELRDRAAEITDHIAENDWDSVRTDFDEVMSDEVTEERLASVWDSLTTELGGYTSRGAPAQVSEPGDLLTFETPMAFERGAARSRVAFRRDGRIAGLLLLPGALRDRPVEQLRERAAEITDLMAANDWAAVREDFDATMAAQLTEDRLRTAWDQVVAAKGPYRSRGEPSEVPGPGEVVVFDTPMAFEQGEMKSRVAFHNDGRVAGLFILVPEAP